MYYITTNWFLQQQNKAISAFNIEKSVNNHKFSILKHLTVRDKTDRWQKNSADFKGFLKSAEKII